MRHHDPHCVRTGDGSFRLTGRPDLDILEEQGREG